ncbi:AAA family ATPase [Vibrio parahaemolyticus]|uniref:AAA family ATPase n=1 Tax=Vibrio harveyi TaxID=669 RepID=UPI00186A8DF5|nr:AAA family ATPase [Vibrio harveyi]MBE3696067.1 AAA family ATPase [Vibrio parahaemolyticus]MBM4919198.1 AAA family ATPase [Vibrio parahaemolyticus]MBM4977848.1 AAA family ATPase [Vibrio parahaemolyticus]MCG9613457.1 AAA family ATPase [Vibrio harveyi]MCG9671898.1 AAA family ATPase [Vibrio harveyi]
MKLVKATFKNFRLLRDVTIDFSTDAEKKLTVIRAENGTGKTTLMSALIWGLYGSKVIKEKLYPLSLAEENEQAISIDTEVRIEFISEEVITRKSQTIVTEKHYLLKRNVTSLVSKNGKDYKQGQDTYTLLESTDTGDQPIPTSQIQSIIDRTLPQHLKDIYFTDGDAALTFIEGSATTAEKRTRVRKAIESLLSMKELESIIKTLKSIKVSLAQQIDNTDYGAKLVEAEQSYQSNEEWILGSLVEIDELIACKSEKATELKQLDSKIEAQLKLGDKASLGVELKNIEKQIDRTKDELKKTIIKQCSILNSKSLAIALIGDDVKQAYELLNKMNDKDKFPMQFIPVLKHAMVENKCLCGSSLDSNDPDGLAKRNYMEQIIEDCQEIDLLNKRASNLFFSTGDYQENEAGSNWYHEYDNTLESNFNLHATLRDLNVSYKSKDAKFSELNDELLNKYREKRKIVAGQLTELSSDIAILNDEVKQKKERSINLKKDVDLYTSKIGKNNKSGGKHHLSNQLLSTYENVFQEIKTTELHKVSEKMNNIFLSMIGAESGLNPNGMMQGCRLTSDYDIQVMGPKDQVLNPDTELNGASRRAITLSFILALTKVSDVIAPNIIDTPLGMTSGLVKQSILKNLIQQGSQVIMFLTYDEIKGVEEIIDKHAGKVSTLSFSGHYPTMLKNEPSSQGESVLCSCNHRQCCQICERTDQTNMQHRI